MAQEHIYSDVTYTALETNKIPDNCEENAWRSDYRYKASLKALKLFSAMLNCMCALLFPWLKENEHSIFSTTALWECYFTFTAQAPLKC